MKNPYTQLYFHCVWGTWDRLPLLTSPIEQPIYAAILAKCRELKCEPLAINGMPDHVHLLVRLHTTIPVAQLLKEVKGASSHLATHEVAPGEFFKWQGTYGAFTLSKSALPEVKAYIERQKEHHAQGKLTPEWEKVESADESHEGGTLSTS
jgi:putative transposase